jgi:hypothetical protein
MTLELFKCGTKVRLLGCDITGIIVDILIKKEAVQYGVAYYNKGDYISVLMIEEQFEAIEPSVKTIIGFK